MTDPFRHGPLHVIPAGPETGVPVVLLHGWGSSAALMQTVSNMLADQCRVLNVDLPGHGKAPIPPEPMGMPEHAAAVADLIRAHSGGRASIVGHSNGGRIGLWMASEPELAPLIDRLALVSPSGVRRPRTLAYHVRRNTARILKAPFSLLPAPIREPGLDWLRHSFVWGLLGSSDYRALEGAMRETFIRLVNTYVEDRLGAIKAPTLLLWGDQDDAVVRAQMDRMEADIPDAGLFVLKDAGHYGFLDRPDVVRGALRSFLEVSA